MNLSVSYWKNRIGIILVVLFVASLWSVMFAFGNMKSDFVLWQTINFIMKASIYISLAYVVGNLMNNEIQFITYTIIIYYIAHTILYIVNCFLYFNDWDGWMANFYDYALLIPAVMILIILAIISNTIIARLWKSRR